MNVLRWFIFFLGLFNILFVFIKFKYMDEYLIERDFSVVYILIFDVKNKYFVLFIKWFRK